ncbi:serine hydrolase domain-containing protein [Paenibacillus cremeus]|uniref:Serine hydrolase n=1 Tax=Paenibacillus cremeus TaxID=2163881 RepID=A0A559K9Q5_9BACL|nr:serine hydrolase [Paenibacillus cremeus]TVY08867.1 serine hydrolase [Paenibacillus cremeus]
MSKFIKPAAQVAQWARKIASPKRFEWKSSSPEAQGLDSRSLAHVFEALPNYNVRSMVVVRNGYVVAEAMNEEMSVETPQVAYSLTKSVLSALTGIAISENKLQLDQKLSHWFPELVGVLHKEDIEIRHLLSMTSGLEWNDYNNVASEQMMYSSDWTEAILAHPAAHAPGTHFNYSNGDAHLLAVVLEKAIGQRLLDYAEAHLFAPLGISQVQWAADPQNHQIGSWGMALPVHDMAKLGLLYLHNGEWQGQAIVPHQWIAETLNPKAYIRDAKGSVSLYGFMWWMKSMTKNVFNTFYAGGSFGQRIFVIPALHLVVAMTAYSSDVDMPEQILNSIINSVIG